MLAAHFAQLARLTRRELLSATESVELSPVALRARARIMRRIVPYMFLLFVIAYLDRVNLGYAQLQMKGDLSFTDDVLGFGAGIFFLGYFFLEIPGSILVEKWSARGWIARIMITWGIVAIGMGFVHTKNQFYFLRFLLGAAEAGFFPGIIVYFSHWFRNEDRAKVVAIFMAAIPISNIIGSPVSGLLLQLDWLNLAGWRWLFIIEGAPAIVLGIVTIFYLTDRPEQAKWLPADERDWIASQLEAEKALKQKAKSFGVLQAMGNREVILLAAGYFFMVTSLYGFGFWLPTIVKKLSGASNLTVSLISALPYCVGLASILFVGWSSDRTKERRWHTALCMIVAGIGLLLSVAARNQAAMAISMFCLAAAGIYGYFPSFWALPTSFLTGTAAAASIGLINSIGNLGGFVGPYLVGYLSNKTGSFISGVLYLALSALIASVMILSLRASKKA
jgi:MFS transporter, ACS family, tartrate transporter